MKPLIRELAASKRLKLKSISAILIILVLFSAAPANADPTATPTPYPTATSQYKDLRPTPTAMSITPVALDFNLNPGNYADTLINGYRMANLSNLVDILGFVVLVGLVISILFDLLNASRSE